MKTKNFKKVVLSCLMAFIFQIGFAQTIDIDFIELVGRNVVVHYSLDDASNSGRQFLVQLYSSQDNFTTPLTRVSGDFGPEVNAGFDKKIVWDVTNELGAFKGNIALELRGRVYVPFVKIKDITEDKVFKRGKNYPINWTSGNLSGQVNIELFNAAGERMWGENNVPNVGKFDWYIPSGMKKGKDYKLKFTNIKDRNDVVYSMPFIIKPKIPLLLKIVGVGVITIGADLVLGGSKSSSPTDQPLSRPPSPNN
jgi:hypothetical protein